MPTGYTDSIYKGIQFEDFVLNCSRAFGALIHMRDDNFDAEITIPEESDFHRDELEKALNRLRRLSTTSLHAAAESAQEDYEREVNYRHERDAKNAQKEAQLTAMLEKVQAWTPPTEDHVGLKKFMIKQIEETIEFDCRPYKEEPVTLKAPQEWLDFKTEYAQRDVDYHMEHLAKERERNASRKKWIVDLFESLGRGAQAEKLKTVKF